MPMMAFQPTESFALELDHRDPLAAYRSRFHIPRRPDGSDSVYLCGNSLGLQPKSVRTCIEEELHDWEALGVDGHFHARHPWLPYHEFLTQQTAALVGALPSEVVVMNTLTVNLHLMMVSFYRPTAERHRIAIEARAFPSDQYAVKSQIRFHGYEPSEAVIELSPRPGEHRVRTEDIESLLERHGQSIALFFLAGVNYYSGQAFDMKRLTRAAQAQGCVVGYDLAHAAGNILLKLHDWNVDFAVWCSYKYLNGGPGTTAGCFVHERHAHRFDLPRFTGWWGSNKATRFQMGPDVDLLPGAEGWQVSNPPILALAALRASMNIFAEAGLERLRTKSELLTGYLEYLLDRHAGQHFSIITPRDPKEQGAQLSILVPKGGGELFETLTRSGIVCDWREPDVIRVAPVPLYNSFQDVYRFAEVFLSARGGQKLG
jgi:kynureninase